MTKFAKITARILIPLLILAFGAELALGWFVCKRLSDSAGSLDGLREDNAALRQELVGLREDFSGLREEFLFLEELTRGQEEDPAQEDGVRIAGDYVIRSTLPISDAYRSGDRSALDDKQKETLDMAAAVLEQIITPEMDDYEKEQAVYRWMTENLAQDEGLLPVIPRTQADCDNPYGVLKFHNAVCVGYATTFRLFMQMLDIPCMVVHNSECYHSWDLVRLGDGWYHTDIYSDAGRASYAHFNLTDSMQALNQNWNTGFFPAANSTEFCYAARGAREETDVYQIPAALREALEQRQPLVALRFDRDHMDEALAQVAQLMLRDVQSRVENSWLSEELYMDWSWMPMDEGWLLSVNLNWYDWDEPGDEPEIELPDDAYERAEDAVNASFGDMEPGEDYYDDYVVYSIEGGK